MSGRAKAHYEQWRGECFDWYSRMKRLGGANGQDPQNGTGPYALGREPLPPTVHNPQNPQQDGQNIPHRRAALGRGPISETGDTVQPNRTPTYANIASRQPLNPPRKRRRTFFPPPHPNAHLIQHARSTENMTRLLVRAETVAVGVRNEWLDRTRPGHDRFTHAVQPLNPNLAAIPRHPVNRGNTPNGRQTPGTINPVPLQSSVGRAMATGRLSDGLPVLARAERSTNGTGQNINNQVPAPVAEIAPAQTPIQPRQQISTPTPAGSLHQDQLPRTGASAPTSSVEAFQQEQGFPDPEWLRAVRNAFGPGGVQQVHQESLRVLMERQRADPSPPPLPGQQQQLQDFSKQLQEQDRRRNFLMRQRQEHLQNQLERAHQLGEQR